MSPLAAVTVLAHQGGWDEILMVLTPIGLFAGLLYVANKRATEKLAARTAEQAAETQTTPDEGSDTP